MMGAVNAARHLTPPPGGQTVAAPVDGVPPSPAARRTARPSWRDPRLLVGLVLVAGSVLAGAQLVGSADDTVAVWSVRGDLVAGTPVAARDLEPAQVRFASEELAARYLPAVDAPVGMVLRRDVAAGELLPRDALGRAGGEPLAQLPVTVASAAVPAGLRPGEVVDVWVTPPAEGSERRQAVRVLEQVRVVAVPDGSGALGPASTRQVLVGVPADERLLADALAGLADGGAVLVRRG